MTGVRVKQVYLPLSSVDLRAMGVSPGLVSYEGLNTGKISSTCLLRYLSDWLECKASEKPIISSVHLRGGAKFCE